MTNYDSYSNTVKKRRDTMTAFGNYKATLDKEEMNNENSIYKKNSSEE